VGREQIEDLASRLRSRGITAIWTSQIARAQESAQILADELKVLVTADSRLEEIGMGPWEGLTELEVASRYSEAHALWQEKPDLVRLPGRETLATVAQRIVATMNDAERRPGSVLLVTHVAPIRVAALTLLGLPLRRYKEVRVNNADCFIAAPHSGYTQRLEGKESLLVEMSAEAPGLPVSIRTGEAGR
jgi:broad specificity phosphatase PhoE